MILNDLYEKYSIDIDRTS